MSQLLVSSLVLLIGLMRLSHMTFIVGSSPKALYSLSCDSLPSSRYCNRTAPAKNFLPGLWKVSVLSFPQSAILLPPLVSSWITAGLFSSEPGITSSAFCITPGCKPPSAVKTGISSLSARRHREFTARVICPAFWMGSLLKCIQISEISRWYFNLIALSLQTPAPIAFWIK